MIRRLLAAWTAIFLLAVASPAAAQEASPQLRAAAERVVAFLKGEAPPDQIFTPAFLQAVPPAQLSSVTASLRAQHGAATGIERLEARSPFFGTLDVATERATLRMSLAIEAQAPHRVAELLVTGAEVRGDSLEAIVAELRALPGTVSFAVARLGEGPPQMVASLNPDQPLAIGSTFKLIILAELSRQVQAGTRRWSDVVTIRRRSLPSGMLQNWPEGSPVTLHTLASMMISISDNTATDILLAEAGRENVERMMTAMGIAAAARNRPFLSTLELFALKTASAADQQAWIGASEAERRRLLTTRYGGAAASAIDPARLSGPPNRIAELEWFASAADLARVVDWLRRHGDETARAIMAISPGGPASLRAEHDYVGFKGGSEPGVINLTWLARNRAGEWHAVTGGWNNPAAAVEEARFMMIMSRALALTRGARP
jgi:beta-lactamase class A